MSKFNDFSRYKNNELRNYFTKKELKFYNSEKEKKIFAKNPFSASIFSFLITSILWSARENYPSWINDVDYLKYFFYTIIVIVSFIISYVIFYLIINHLISFVITFIEKIRNSFGGINSEKISEDDKLKEKDFLDMFKYEVVSQIALSLSIITHIEEEEDKEKIHENKRLENKFYANEAFQYLNDALQILNLKIINSKYKDKISDKKYTKININKINELIELSDNLINRISTFWEDEEIKDNYVTEIQEIKDTNNLIKIEISTMK